jgi:hypothetical protein
MDRDVAARGVSMRAGTKAFDEAMGTYDAGRTDDEAVAAARCFWRRHRPPVSQVGPMKGD